MVKKTKPPSAIATQKKTNPCLGTTTTTTTTIQQQEQQQKLQKLQKLQKGDGSIENAAAAEVPNRPRNFYVTDATNPFYYSFQGRFGLYQSLTIHQKADEETWPGGALWDIGVLLSNLLLGLGGVTTATTSITNTMRCFDESSNNKADNHSKKKNLHSPTSKQLNQQAKIKSKNHKIQLPSRLTQSIATMSAMSSSLFSEDSVVLELGCGVGLTGLVAAAILRPKLVLLTDLEPVITHVTQFNVEQNTQPIKRIPQRRRQQRGIDQNQMTTILPQSPPSLDLLVLGNTVCQAIPLCWGNPEDEENVSTIIQDFQTVTTTTTSTTKQRKLKKKPVVPVDVGLTTTTREPVSLDDASNCRLGKADLILIGDVAYQHKPGAPSHFEALHSTLLQLVHDDTLVVFGTRIRMPASNDLLELLLTDLEPVCSPPLRADEIDPLIFGGGGNKLKHNITIHLLKKRRKENERQ